MTNCVDCIHKKLCYELCESFYDGDDNTCAYCKLPVCPEKANCEYFEDKSQYMKLPCRIGDIVYMITMQRDSYDDSERRIIAQIPFRLGLLKNIGNTVFITYEEAEKAKERK